MSAFALSLLLVASGSSVDSGTFSHAVHLALEDDKLDCATCHPIKADARYVLLRPGSDQHAPCDRCHADAFVKTPGPFCLVCHERTDPLRVKQSPLREYPRRTGALQLITSFSHREHLALDDVSCERCHRITSEQAAFATFPNHAECATCHDSAIKPNMTDCRGCHAAEIPGKVRRFISNDVRFTHGKHAGVQCVHCHHEVSKSVNASQVDLPRMKDCAVCHKDAQRTPASARIDHCGVCHVTDVTSGPLPSSHTVSPSDLFRVARAGEGAPEDHSPLFRRRHDRAARAPDAKCAYCHVGTSGSNKDPCMDCHAVSRPRSHDLRFSSVSHGRTAARDPSRCAVCHEIDYCTECHSIPPQNHFPLSLFNARHARAARTNTRACLTCHTFDGTCAECHSTGTARGSIRRRP